MESMKIMMKVMKKRRRRRSRNINKLGVSDLLLISIDHQDQMVSFLTKTLKWLDLERFMRSMVDYL